MIVCPLCEEEVENKNENTIYFPENVYWHEECWELAAPTFLEPYQNPPDYKPLLKWIGVNRPIQLEWIKHWVEYAEGKTDHDDLPYCERCGEHMKDDDCLTSIYGGFYHDKCLPEEIGDGPQLLREFAKSEPIHASTTADGYPYYECCICNQNNSGKGLDAKPIIHDIGCTWVETQKMFGYTNYLAKYSG